MQCIARRQFLVQSAAAAALAGAASAKPAPNDPWADMTWLNPPAAFTRDGDVFRITAAPKTDFWRHTAVNFVADNGHFLHRTVKGKFIFEARLDGAYKTEADQVGLMVRNSPEVWMKCGAEHFAGKRTGCVAFTRDYSDWSTIPRLPETGPLWFRIERQINALDIWVSADGKNFEIARSGYYPPSDSVELGLMVCSATGNGFEAVFDQLKLS